MSDIKASDGSQHDVEEGINHRGRERQREGSGGDSAAPARCINPASDINARLDTQVEVRVYPCNNSSQGSGKKKFTTFTIKPEVSFRIVPTLRFWIVYQCCVLLSFSGCHNSRF